ncbi:alpha/beta hydrolase [Verrucomicrobium sp. BvORR034]|uniref:alpha/beta hydrolase n=1 Tax=Verrucomicrobium sp. BvORR034 TaxID=1396418 RepID=UPI000679307B|nr:alpha/beta hydrolase [Verrucomicrobium sp. BvORR034]
MKRRVVVMVNGIMTVPGNSRNWTGRGVTWTHLWSPAVSQHGCQLVAERLEYFSGPLLSRALGQKDRAQKLQRMLEFYYKQDWEVTLVGHSNGCDVILDTLAAMGWPRVRDLHLVSAACESDFAKNGLNAAGDRIGSIHVYVADADWALWLAGSWVGKLLGYGTLGRQGPVGHNRVVNVIHRPFGHSEWFSDSYLDETMSRIIGAEVG